jgi:sulfite reductase alpha subunit-like flavoprotein
MVLHPINIPENVEKFIALLNLEVSADQLIQFVPTTQDPVPAAYMEPISIRELFQYHLDIYGRPRRYFFRLLSFFSGNKQHRDKLIEFSEAQGQDDLYAYCNRPRRTFYEVISDFNTVQVPLKYVPDLFPLMRPRYFSICSSLQVVEIYTGIKKQNRNHCSYCELQNHTQGTKSGGMY